LTQGTLDQEPRGLARDLLGEALERDLPDATLDERRSQAWALARLGDRATLLRVATGALAARELPRASRRAALESLARLGRQEATEATLESLVRDQAVGDDAALALARLRNETFFELSWRAVLAPPATYR
jgi:hypothetical protein